MGDRINTRQYPSLTKSSTFSSRTKLMKSQSGLMDWCHQIKKYCMYMLSRPYFCQTECLTLCLNKTCFNQEEENLEFHQVLGIAV